jgi:hypothetical protein
LIEWVLFNAKNEQYSATSMLEQSPFDETVDDVRFGIYQHYFHNGYLRGRRDRMVAGFTTTYAIKCLSSLTL